jgi:hypothetical protein
MVFWFVGTAVVSVWFVFRDPRFDYRLLVIGSVLPAPIDAALGGARALHSIVVSVAVLALVMAITAGRKPIRRTLLGLPVGMLLHLVFTGAWTTSTVFWWPLFGLDFDDARHPVAARGLWNVPLELAGIAICWWIVTAAGLRDRNARHQFLATGRLSLPAG